MDSDGTLNYSEFLNLVLSDNNYTLRRIARERLSYSHSRVILPYDVEYSMTKIFERELDLVRNVEIILNDVKSRYDFNVYDLYSSIQTLSYLTGENVRKFLYRNDAEVNESDIRAITKRLDTDRDTRISFTEFKRLFEFPGVTTGKDNYTFKNSSTNFNESSTFYNTKSSIGKGYLSPMRRTASPLRRPASPQAQRGYYSPNRSMNSSVHFQHQDVLSSTSSILRSPLRNTMRSSSPIRSPVRTTLRSPYRSPLRSTVRSPYRSPLRSPRAMNTTSELLNRSLIHSTYVTIEEENFVQFLRETLDIESEVERAKCDLALRSDFNVEDAFRIFELDCRGYLTDLDLKYGLNALDIFPTNEEINLLVRRFDIRNEGVLSYANFFDLIAPVDREYRRMVENRLPSNYTPKYSKQDVFLATTKSHLQNLFNLHLRAEARLEGWRQTLNKLLRFNIRQLFEKIDRLDKGYFTDADVNIIF